VSARARLFVLAALVASSPAQADRRALSTPLATQAARAHYEAGVVYYQQGDPRRALAEFLAAQRDDDRPALDFDIASCYERLGDPARAAQRLRRFLERDPSVPDRSLVQARIARLEESLGELRVRASPADVTLTLDDDTTPLPIGSVVRVGAGRHQVSATREGYLPRGIDVVVTRGALTEGFIDLGPPPAEHRRKRRALAIGLGIAGGALVIGGAIVVGVVLGTRGRLEPFVGNVGVITVNP
jgi:tetratricopeptide (TPR) repeat protein